MNQVGTRNIGNHKGLLGCALVLAFHRPRVVSCGTQFVPQSPVHTAILLKGDCFTLRVICGDDTDSIALEAKLVFDKKLTEFHANIYSTCMDISTRYGKVDAAQGKRRNDARREKCLLDILSD